MAVQQSKCRSEKCGRNIVWATNRATGKNVPLDSAAIYLLTEDAAGDPVAIPARSLEQLLEAASRMSEKQRSRSRFRVSHFNICKDPDRFSGGRGGSNG